MTLLAAGCASPGPPRAPSLQLPQTVSDLVATRRGQEVELQFAVPTRTSDGMAYRGSTVRARVCRAVESGVCVPVASLSGVVLAVAAPAGAAQRATLQDALPAALTTGAVRLLTYRVELSNAEGRTAGFGDAAFAAAGAAPAGVAGLRAVGARGGVEVRWQPSADGRDAESDVVLRRELVSGTGVAGESRRTGASGTAGASGEPRLGPAERGRGRGADARAGGGGGGGSGAGTGGGSGPGTGAGAGRATQKSGEAAGVVWLSTAPVGDPLRGSEREGQEGSAAGKVAAGKVAMGKVAMGTVAMGTVRPGDVSANTAHGVLDDSAVVGSLYRYAAERQRTAQLGGHTLVLHSGLSAPVEVALRAVYPPPAPTDLVGTVFPLTTVDDSGSGGAQGAGLAVDLIWTPADDAVSPENRTVGYLVDRELVDAGGRPVGGPTRLTATPVRVPAFHDVLPTALFQSAGQLRIRYRVMAVDANGLPSPAVTTVVETSGR